MHMKYETENYKCWARDVFYFMKITDEKLLFSYNDYNQKRGFKMTTSRDTIINLTRMTSTFNPRQSQLCLQHVSSKNTL